MQCVGNECKRYDGKVWLEHLQDIVEVSGRQISEPLCPSSFKEGDAVKVHQLVKGGCVKLWNGVVVMSPLEERSAFNTTLKPGQQSPSTTPRKRKQQMTDTKKPKARKIGELLPNYIAKLLVSHPTEKNCERRPSRPNVDCCLADSRTRTGNTFMAGMLCSLLILQFSNEPGTATGIVEEL